MVHVSREVRNANGEIVKLTVVYDLNGVSIVKELPETDPETTLYTHEEAAVIYDLMAYATPRYKNM